MLVKVLQFAGLAVLFIASLVLIYILILGVSAACVKKSKEYSSESRYYRWLLNVSTAMMEFLLKIKVSVSGTEQIPKACLNGKKNFLLVSNHRSNYDPLITWYAFKACRPVFISKPENFRIPFFGRLIHRLRFIPINRDNPFASGQAVKAGTKLLKEDSVCVAVYPEGKRSLDCKVLPFHPLVFSMAYHAQVPVVAVTIEGTETIRKKTPWHKSYVSVRFADYISENWIKEHGIRELCARAENSVKGNLCGGGNNG